MSRDLVGEERLVGTATTTTSGMSIGGAITSGTAGRVPFEDTGPVLADDPAFLFDKSTGKLSATSIALSGLTSGRVPVASTAGLLIDDAGFLYDTSTDTLTSGALVLSSATAPVLKSTITDAGAATQIEAGRFQHLASVTGTVGIGVYQSFWASNAVAGGGTLAEAARVKGMLRGVTNGTENGALEFVLNAGGAMTSAGHITGTTVNGATTIGVGTISATGVTTQVASMIGNNGSVVGLVNGSASNGGWCLSGTVNTSAARSFLIVTPSANTGITTLTERITNVFGSGHTNGVPSLTSIVQTWAAGTVATQRDTVFVAPTYAFASASTMTTAATVAIIAAPIAGTNATITNAFSLWVQAGATRLDGVLDLSGIAAGTSNIKITKTSDTPTTTFSAVNATNAAPSGFIEITEGGTSKYIPFYT